MRVATVRREKRILMLLLESDGKETIEDVCVTDDEEGRVDMRRTL